MNRLQRSVPQGGIRAVEVEGRPTIRLQLLRYRVVDSYGSLWMPGCLTAGIRQRLPQLTWGHRWDCTLGRALPDTYEDSEGGPFLDFYLDDFDAVPLARQAYAQVKSGTVDDCSIGFDYNYVWRQPTDEERVQYPGVVEVMLEADLDEVSLVLRGAVPGAKVLAVRSRFLGQRMPMMIDAEEAARIITEVKGGHMDLFSALQQVNEASVTASDVEIIDPTVKPEKEPEVPVETPVQPEPIEEKPVEEPQVEPTVETEPKAVEPEVAPEPETKEPEVEPTVETPEDEPEPEVEPETKTEPEVEPTPVFSDSDLEMLADVDSVLAEREAV